MTPDSAPVEMSEDASVPVLEVEDLRVELRHGSGRTTILEDVSYSVLPGSSVALVGESGAGKSVSVRAVLDLLDRTRFEVTGRIRLCGTDLMPLSPKARRRYISSVASLVFQDPTRALNPTMRVGWQIAEAMHKVPGRAPMSKDAARERSIQLMRDVGIADPEERFYAFPHQLSGGMRQRIVIAIALSCEPRVMFCDEPTSSLDVTTQAVIMDLLESLQQRFGISIVFITHDLALASSRVDEVMVMYGGRLVESLPAGSLFERASMPYTQALLRAVPDPDGAEIPLALRSGLTLAAEVGRGCIYAGECWRVQEQCALSAPEFAEIAAGHRCRCWFPTTEHDLELEELLRR